MSAALRNTLVETCLAWQKSFGVSPHVTSAISELDAARLVGLSSRQYSLACKGRTAVSAGYDFKYGKNRYQMKANRPSGAKGSKVTRVGKPKNLNWDILIWILYNERFEIQEAWRLNKNLYCKRCLSKERLSPDDYRIGQRIFPKRA